MLQAKGKERRRLKQLAEEKDEAVRLEVLDYRAACGL